MRILLVIYAVASLLLVYMGWASNRQAQFRRQSVLATIRQIHPRDESTEKFYRETYPNIEHDLHQGEVDTMDFERFGCVSFIFTVFVFIGYSALQRKRVQPSAGANSRPVGRSWLTSIVDMAA
jgi:hypothetical protein